jgi:hypothetical protein
MKRVFLFLSALSKIMGLIHDGILPKERGLQQDGKTHGPREACHDDFPSLGMVKPEQERDRFRTGTNARCK